MKCCVDLRNRVTGNTEQTLLVTESADDAWRLVNKWNRTNISGFDENTSLEDYIDGTEGLVADCYYVEGNK